MVKALTLLLLLAVMSARASCAPQVPQVGHRPHRLQQRSRSLLDDVASEVGDVRRREETRSERSANLSHHSAAGANARKIQFFVKNYHLQILPDGTVNGTLDDSSIFTILQRTAVGIGKLKIQGVGTCQYLCMAPCGLLYGSRQFSDECVFNEMIQQHHYNTYSSSKYSNGRRTLYLAFNRRGISRRVLLHVGLPLGRLSQFTRVMTRLVPATKLDEMQPPMRHHAHLCDSSPPQMARSLPTRCRRHKKRKRKKRKCVVPEDEDESGDGDANCELQQPSASGSSRCEDESSDDCQRHADETRKKRTKKKPTLVALPKTPVKAGAPRKRLKTTTPMATTLVDDFTDDDYTIDSTTGMMDWDVDATMMTPLHSDEAAQD